MKRTVALLIAVLLAVAVALPVMASPYTDLPDSHWALSAVYELSALGIFEGYPDGTFKGPQPSTRYELALVISRLLKFLDQEINARIAAVESKIPTVTEATVVPTTTPVPTPAPVTTVVQVEPDQTILETIIREKIEALVGPKFEDIDEKIAELYAMIQDLKAEFARELSVLGVRVTALEADMAQVKARLAKAEASVNALQLQLDPALVRITVLESRADAYERQLAELNQKIAGMPVPSVGTADVESLKVLIAGLEKDNAALAAKVAALEGRPVAVTPVIPASAKPEDVDALKALIAGLQKDKAALEARIIALEGKPAVAVPAAAKPEDVDALKAQVTTLNGDVTSLKTKVAALEGRPPTIAPAPVIPASAKPEDVEALKTLIAGLQKDKAALEARIATLEGKPAVVIPAAAKPEDVDALKALILGLEKDNAALEARMAAIEGRPATVVPATVIPATVGIADFDLLKSLVESMQKVNASLEARVAALEAKPGVTIPAAAKPEEVDALKALMLSMEKDKAALAARVSALESAQPVVIEKPVTTVQPLSVNLDAAKVDALTTKLGALESKVLALESKLNTVDTRVGFLELKASETDDKLAKLAADVALVDLQSGQNATDIIDLYSMSYKNADDLSFLKVDLASKFAALEAKVAANSDSIAQVAGISSEGLALLKLDILEAQDDIEKLKALYAQVAGMAARIEAAETQLMLLGEKVAMLNMDLASLESEKVDNALFRTGQLELQTADLYDKYGMLVDALSAMGLDVARNSDDINDLYIQQNHTTNLLKNLQAADVAMNDRVTAIETENKIKADELSKKVAALESASAANAAEALSLSKGLMGLADKVSSLWINKFLLTGSFEVKFTDVEVVNGLPFVDPFDNTTDPIVPTNAYYGKLTLKGIIKPEPGVEIAVGLNAGLDTYGITDASALVFNGDLDIKVTSPNGYGQIIGGEQARPKYLSKYVFSSILFGDAKFEGLGGWGKYTPEGVEGLTLGASAILAKKGSTTDFRYVWGLAGNINYADAADLTLYYFAVDDRPNSGDLPGTYVGSEDHIGINADFKLGKDWTAGAFANLFLNDVNPDPEYAITAYIKGKLGVWSTSLTFERVSNDYTPMYAEFVDTDDPDIIANDMMNLTFNNSFEVLPGLVFGLDSELDGDEDWGNLTHTNEVYAKYSFGKSDALFNGSLKLYGGRESEIVVGDVWNVPVPDADGQCYAGADLKLKLYIFNAGFSYYTETYDIAGVYAGIKNKYTAYLNTELSLIPDVLKAKAGWKGVFGDFAGSNYQEVYGELNLTTGFAVKWNLAANLGAYFKTTTMFKVYGNVKLTYNMTDTASLWVSGSGEYRNSISAAKPDGFVLSAGAGYTQKIFSSTNLVVDFNTKYVKYTYNPGGYLDNLVHTLGVKLSTTF